MYKRQSKKSAKTSDTPHYENVPFEVPESWVWCRLDDIVCELKYGTSEKSSSVGKIAVLRMGNITNVGTIDYSNLVYSSNDEDIEQYLSLIHISDYIFMLTSSTHRTLLFVLSIMRNCLLTSVTNSNHKCD